MRAAFARAGRKSSSFSPSQQSKDSDRSESSCADAPPGLAAKTDHRQQIKVKVKSASVESNQTVPGVRCPSLTTSYDEEAGAAGPRASERGRASSQERLDQRQAGGLCYLPVSPLRPSISSICLSSAVSADEANHRDCDIAACVADKAARSNRAKKQPAASALVCIPTRASLTHEWRRLKTPNKCRECNLLVYFNGRECSICGFVAHKKCIAVLVIKCSRRASLSSVGACPALKPDKQAAADIAQVPAGALGAAFLSLRNPNIRPFAGLAGQQAGRRPIFGQPIGAADSEQVLDFVNRAVLEIDTRGLTSKNIYRVSSIKSKVDKLCHYYDQNPSNLIDLSSFHPNIIANALKSYLRKLPDPLLTSQLYDSFIDIAKRHSSQQQAQQRKSADSAKEGSAAEMAPANQQQATPSGLLAEFEAVLERLPAMNRELAGLIMRHLKRVAELADENHMSAKNLSIIFGPTLLSAGDHSKSSVAIADNIHQARLVELMIDWAYQIFPSLGAASDQC